MVTKQGQENISNFVLGWTLKGPDYYKLPKKSCSLHNNFAWNSLISKGFYISPGQKIKQVLYIYIYISQELWDLQYIRAKRKLVHNLPQKWWNSTNNGPHPCIYRMNLLQWSIHKCIKNQVGSSKPSSQHISLEQPCHKAAMLVPQLEVFGKKYIWRFTV